MKTKLKILFRTSGGRALKKQLGFGHINRCTNLSQYFTKEEIFFLIEDYGEVRKFLKSKKIKNVSNLKKNLLWKEDLTKQENS